MSRGRGRGYGDPIPAENLVGQSEIGIYFQDNSDRIDAQIRVQHPDLVSRLNGDGEDEYERDVAEAELYDRGFTQSKKEFDSLPASEKKYYEQQALEAKYETWRRFREMGRLIENDESLAQKARDSAMGITGPIGGRGRGRGRGGGANVLHQQGMGAAFVGGTLVRTPLEEMTPPYDRNTIRVKVGKIESEEYF